MASSVAAHESWLRIGVVRGGNVVEDRWLRPGRSLTWGRSERADVVVARAPDDRATLIEGTGEGWSIARGATTLP
jgi:hypothetical protein